MADWFAYETRNDAEVALCHSLNGLRGQVPGSFACCELSPAGLVAYRNTDRPLWLGHGDGFYVCASTHDALSRCGVKDVRQATPGKVYDVMSDGIVAQPFGWTPTREDQQTAPHYNPLSCLA